MIKDIHGIGLLLWSPMPKFENLIMPSVLRFGALTFGKINIQKTFKRMLIVTKPNQHGDSTNPINLAIKPKSQFQQSQLKIQFWPFIPSSMPKSLIWHID